MVLIELKVQQFGEPGLPERRALLQTLIFTNSFWTQSINRDFVSKNVLSVEASCKPGAVSGVWFPVLPRQWKPQTSQFCSWCWWFCCCVPGTGTFCLVAFSDSSILINKMARKKKKKKDWWIHSYVVNNYLPSFLLCLWWVPGDEEPGVQQMCRGDLLSGQWDQVWWVGWAASRILQRGDVHGHGGWLIWG